MGLKHSLGSSELLAGDPNILLIDEPEAFLHPSLASKLGHEVARAALSADKRVFASTHSPQFVVGCIQSGAPINIIRLTYRGGVATARVLPSDEILELMRHPLLRSTGVLSGLFYEFVVVTESDADRAFYQEVNERLLQLNPGWGIPNEFDGPAWPHLDGYIWPHPVTTVCPISRSNWFLPPRREWSLAT
ncbi:MAG: AAA family ATPase, partial [Bryobacterales bacterium]|nr:AAA family ATPase [Bryobacterales bacterium]